MPEAQGFVHSVSKWWQTNDKAENLNNLPVGYYEQLLGGKNLDWIRCYAEGKFTYVQKASLYGVSMTMRVWSMIVRY